jgi:hypothetical protein
MTKMTFYLDALLAWLNVHLTRLRAGKARLLSVHLPRIGAHVRYGSAVTAARLSAAGRFVRAARQLRLFVMELAGIVLTTYGISWWSVPAAVIIGGLVLVAAVEVRPHVATAMPALPIPDALVRAQAEQAARLINNARYGIAEVDISAMDKLSRRDCEQIITVARGLAASSAVQT